MYVSKSQHKGTQYYAGVLRFVLHVQRDGNCVPLVAENRSEGIRLIWHCVPFLETHASNWRLAPPA